VFHGLLVVFVAASVSFLLLHFAPGDPISTIADVSGVSPELRAQWRAQKGYDQPVPVQYARWLNNVAHGEFGVSSSQNRSVSAVILERLPNTLALMSLALTASIAIGAAVGAWQGTHAGSRRDRTLSFASLLLYSVPEFWLGLLLMWLFVLLLPTGLPAGGMVSDVYESLSRGQRFVDRLSHLVLPWASLTIMGAAIFSRYQRAAMRDVLHESFLRTARAGGLDESHIRRHAWRVAVLPVVSLAGLFFPALLTGAVFVEHVFSWPGMGETLLKAIGARDYELVSGCIIVGSAMTAIGNALADVVRLQLDPRLRIA
jgi:peptide/nickel transport system permease protein